MLQKVFFSDLGRRDYQETWDFQENLLRKNVDVKWRKSRDLLPADTGARTSLPLVETDMTDTINYLLFVEHPPVYTLGKTGHEEHLLLPEAEIKEQGIDFVRTNRGGDITFHGPGQIVGYPILDLEKFGTDIGMYLRNLEETIIRTLADYGIRGDRSRGQTGVWLDPGMPGKARKIAALGVRCSRWITMHGFALNVNTDLQYFDGIVPCGIRNKQVSSMALELGRPVSTAEVKAKLRMHFESVFEAELLPAADDLLTTVSNGKP